MSNEFGKDWALNAKGIYYRDCCTSPPENELIWVPSPQISDDGSPEALDQQRRAENLAKRARDNKKRTKTEFDWEVDAWADVFPRMRDDPCLEGDKYEYRGLLTDPDKTYSHLTGTSWMARRIPDATFGLTTFLDRDAQDPCWTSCLHSEKLERLMVHPNYGLISDPKIITSDPNIITSDLNDRPTSLAFPFMVYEAKGWEGNYRVARVQACEAAAVCLDLLENLAREPGPIDIPRPYQTCTSNRYQVFALTSSASYWEVLVGNRRARLGTEHAGSTGSESIYMFQRLWSGYITNESNARQLLSLVDQIHNWATTDFRDFVLEHLTPWHQLCDDNYLLGWRLKYTIRPDKKRKRGYSRSWGVTLPIWVDKMPIAFTRRIRERARASIGAARLDASMAKGEIESPNKDKGSVICVEDSCNLQFDSDVEYLRHLRTSHNYDDRQIAQLRWNEYI